MHKISRTHRSSTRAASIDVEQGAGSQSYFQWREQTVRMPAVRVRQQSQASSLVRLFRRISGKV